MGNIEKQLKAENKALKTLLGILNDLQDGYLKTNKENKARIARLEAGLKTLVTLKEYKDTRGKSDEYLREQPVAWKNARDLLSESPTQSLEAIKREIFPSQKNVNEGQQ